MTQTTDPMQVAGDEHFQIHKRGEGIYVLSFNIKNLLDETHIQNMLALAIDWIESKQRNEGNRELIVDFSNLEHVSSAAFGAFITLHNRLKARDNATLRFVNVAPQIREVFTITSLDKRLFKVHETMDTALADIGKGGRGPG
jgi:anti-anti-sigma factor